MSAPGHSFGSPIPGARGGGLRLVALAAALTLVGCAAPTRESLRPSGIDVWAEGGRARFDDLGTARTTSRDWSGGINVHFDLVYPDDVDGEE